MDQSRYAKGTEYGQQLGNLKTALTDSSFRGEGVGYVIERLNEQEHLCTTLADELKALEARLAPILRPEPPGTEGNSGTAPAPVTSPVAEGLSAFNVRLHQAICRLRAIQARLDI